MNWLIEILKDSAKVFEYEVFSGSCFLVFVLNTDVYRVNLSIQSEYGKIQTRKNSLFEHVLRIVGEVYLNYADISKVERLRWDFRKSKIFFLRLVVSYLCCCFYRNYSSCSEKIWKLTISSNDTGHFEYYYRFSINA